MHAVAAVLSWSYLPTSHSLHGSVDPALYLPAAQTAHGVLALESASVAPALHRKVEQTPVAPASVPVGTKWPGPHTTQGVTGFESSSVVPAGHACREGDCEQHERGAMHASM